jgi:hypothetical protein
MKALDCARRSYKPRQLHGSGRPPALGGDHRRGIFEAAIISVNAMKVPDWFNRSTLTIEILLKQMETL